MAKAEWGTKRVCPKCSAKFYDLKKKPATCPACAHSFDPEAPVKKAAKPKAAEKPAPKVEQPEVVDDEPATGLPEIEDLEIIDDMDDLDEVEEVEDIKEHSVVDADDENEDDEAFIEDEKIMEEEALIEAMDEDQDDEEDAKQG